MQTEIVTSETSNELTEPHFDDEATVLQARPVVPLTEVSNETAGWPMRRVALLAAVAIVASLLGVAVAAVYYSRSASRAAEPMTNSQAVTAGAEGIATDQIEARNPDRGSASAPTEEAADSDESPGVEAAPRPKEKRPVARRVAIMVFPSNADKEERKAARREAKERKRELERESRDLRRIREIFEGPQRP